MHSWKILLADPDEMLLDEYEHFLCQACFNVATAKSGLECVAKLRSFVPDVLVLEPDLPWGRGEGVLARMHEDLDVPRVPVLVLADRLDAERLRCMDDFQVSAYYVKPLSPLELSQCIQRVLNITQQESLSVGAAENTPS
jgi:DNA-binding response OmpR family regulator